MNDGRATNLIEVDTTAEDDPSPVVRLPREGIPGAAIAGAAIVLAIVLFLAINGRRLDAEKEAGSLADNGYVTSPAPLDVPQAANEGPSGFVVEPAPLPISPLAPVRVQPVPSATSSRTVTSPPTSWVPPQAPEQFLAAPQQFLAAPPLEPMPPSPSLPEDEPALIIDGGATVPKPRKDGATGEQAGKAVSTATQATDQRQPPIRPRRIANRSMVVAAGTLIPAVLETPIDTARPGMVRAIVSRDARGFDGRVVLVPRASRLIGEYQADVRTGQNRVLVTWTTLVLPDGTQVELKSPTADSLGGAGIPGKVHSYFFARFFRALLQTSMTVGTNLAIRSAGGGSIIVALPAGQASSSLGQELLPSDGYKPKITVRQGVAIKVFVARDIDFSATDGPYEAGNQ